LQTSFTESSTNGATVTINRSGSTFRSAGVIDAGYLYPGATNTFSNSTTDFLNFGATDSFTLVAAMRAWGSSSTTVGIAKRPNGFGNGASISLGTSTKSAGTTLLNTTAAITNSTANNTYVDGNLSVVTGVVNYAGNTYQTFLNNTSSSANTATGYTTTNDPFTNWRVGAYGTSVFGDQEIYAAAVFRTATLTTKNIADITNYFQGRD
jgi:hypothetical protein